MALTSTGLAGETNLATLAYHVRTALPGHDAISAEIDRLGELSGARARELETVVSALVSRLNDPHAFFRQAAVQALGNMGPAAASAVPALIARFRIEKPDVQATIAQVLPEFGPAAKAAVPVLMQFADCKDAEVREWVLRALGKLGDGKAAPVLFKALADSNKGNEVAGFAITALSDLGPSALPEIIRQFDSTNQQVRAYAAQAAGGLGPMAGSALVRALQAKAARVRRTAAEAVDDLPWGCSTTGQRPPAILVPALVKALDDPVPSVRAQAAHALGVMSDWDASARSAVPKLIVLLKDPNLKVREEAASALGRMGTAAKPAIPALIGLLHAPEPGMRAAAAAGLAIGPAAAPAVPELIPLLSDPRWQVRGHAINTLSRIGPAAAKAIPKMIEEFNDTGRMHAALTALSIGGDSGAIPGMGAAAVGPLRHALSSQTFRVREFAAVALGRLGARAAAAVPNLIVALDDTNATLRLVAAGALGRIGPQASEAVPVLIQRLDMVNPKARTTAGVGYGQIGPEGRARQAAIVALGQMGPAARAAVPKLCQIINTYLGYTYLSLNSEDSGNNRARSMRLLACETAAKSLGQIHADSPDAVATLIRLLEAPTAVSFARSEAAEALGRIHSPEALSALLRCLKNHPNSGPALVIKAIGKFGPQAAPAAPQLERELNTLWRSKVILALLRIDPNNQAALGTLLASLAPVGQHHPPGDAIRLVRKIPVPGPKAVHALVQALRPWMNTNVWITAITRSAAAAIVHLAPENASARARLIRDLHSDSAEVRVLTAEDLSGVRSPDVVAALESLRHDPFYCVREAAAKALAASP